MKHVLAVALCLFASSAFADTCRTIDYYDETHSSIYVVCPQLPNFSVTESREIVEAIFSSRVFVPDEYLIYFVTIPTKLRVQEVPADTLVGTYDTDSNSITFWPKLPEKKRVLQFER